VFVLNADGQLVGMLDTRLRVDDPSTPIAELITSPSVIFDETTTLPEAMNALEGFVGDVIPVINSATGQMTGIVRESAIIKAYLKAIRGLRQEENAPA